MAVMDDCLFTLNCQGFYCLSYEIATVIFLVYKHFFFLDLFFSSRIHLPRSPPKNRPGSTYSHDNEKCSAPTEISLKTH